MAWLPGIVLFILTILFSKTTCKPVNKSSITIKNKKLIPKDHIPAVKLERDGHINPDFHHEAFLGRLVENGQLNLKDVDGSKKLIEIFHKVDLNNNHKVDKQELAEWIHLRIQEHYEHALKVNKDNFKTADKNNDGILSLQEYMQGVVDDDKMENDALKIEEQTEEELKGLMEEIMPDDLNRWNKADKNRDSKLSQEEFLSFQHPEHNEQSIEAMAEDLMGQMDDDRDLKLTMDEFVRVPPGEVDDPDEKAEDERYFKERRTEFSDQMDVDKDGKVSMEELIKYLDPRHKQHAVKESDYLLSVADSDHDGELSEKEMITNYKLFTGSSMASNPSILHEEF
ncbi:45 kDa calcium-binding protein-like [Dendronephthya gigantea]|uniref:45 kDa calcium-binding protein-like n=1 Tax=Dendronephthya gigantea TaxID=151771 RepID=UPI00106C626C|nr:45 kDa calcium-binding protein-like [Dendronephthya gigantea]